MFLYLNQKIKKTLIITKFCYNEAIFVRISIKVTFSFNKHKYVVKIGAFFFS